MAALFGSVEFGHASSVPLLANVAKTIVQITAAPNHRVRVYSLDLYFDGTQNSAIPIECRYGWITTAGTLATGSFAPLDSSATETFQTQVGINATAEPTYLNYLKTFTIHPQTGMTTIFDEISRSAPTLGGGKIFGVVLTAQAAVNVRGSLEIEE